MSKFTDDIAAILADPNRHGQCMQIAPFGPDRCAILWEIGTQDHDIAYSVVFDVTSFDPGQSRQIMRIDDWWISLTSPGPDELFALEVGRTVWRYLGGTWTSMKVARNNQQRLWSFDRQLTLLVGDDGQSWRFDGAAWSALAPDRARRLRDAHGPTRDLIHSVGAFGTLQRLVGAGWQAVELPLENELWGVFVTSDGRVRAAGDGGTCIEIVDEELIALDVPRDSRFFAVHQFQGETYWGDSAFGIYRQEGNALVEFHDSGTGWDLRADADFLYAVGGGIAWRFDGRKWNSLRLDFDGTDLRLIQ
jgi:hypothetical protein